MIRTDDPILDYERYDAALRQRVQTRPLCAGCEEHIQDEYAVEIDGQLYCERCIEEARRYIED